jgi:pimeloyl-ACP methyl ester carboxylesterase
VSRLPEDFLPPAPVEHFHLTSGGIELAVQVHGVQDAPTVVLVHGWTLSAEYWSRVIRRLRDHLRVVTFDQRGHGHSSPVPPEGFSTEALANDLSAVLKATVPGGEQAILAGHSMGAMAVVALAAHLPDVVRDRVRGVLLASTGVEQLLARTHILPEPPRRGRNGTGPEVTTGLIDVMSPRDQRLHKLATVIMHRGLSEPRLLRVVPPTLMRAVLAHMTLSPAASSAERHWTADVVMSTPPATTAGFATMLGGLDLTAGVAHLRVPTMVLVGASDRLTPPWHAHRLASTLPDCVGLMELPGIGHMTPLQAPDALADAVFRVHTKCSSARTDPAA